MKANKLVVLLLVFAVTSIMLIGCGGNTNEPVESSPSEATEEPTVAPSEAPAEEPIVVGIATANADEFTANLESLYTSLAPDYNIEPHIVNASGDISTQISNVESLIAAGPDVIVLRCIDADIGDTLVSMVKEAGIACIVDETLPTTNTDYDVNVAGDQIIHGNLIGMYLQEYLEANPDETVNLLYINGGTSENIRKRMTGIFEACASDRLVQIGDELGSWSASTAQEITEAYLTSHPEVNAIACANDEMALGVISALKAAHKLDEVMVFGVDGSESGQAAIKSGEMTATTLNKISTNVEIIYDCAVSLAKGEALEYTDPATKQIDPKAYVLLTADNIDTEGTY